MTLPVFPASPARLVVVGLGPGRWEQLTLEAWEILQASPVIYLRTARHPTVDQLRRRLPAAQLVAFDEVYKRAPSFDAVYEEIADRLLALAGQEGATGPLPGAPVVFAVPGHPVVGERVTALLRERAADAGVTLRLVEGLSFLEPVLSDLGFDPLGSGLLVLDAASLGEAPPGWDGQGLDVPLDPRVARAPSPRLLDTSQPLLLAQLYSAAIASSAKLWLLERYPPDHPCLLLRAAGSGGALRREVPLAELDHPAAQPAIDYLTTLYVPPLERLHDLRSLHTLAGIVDRLRAPNGCPWDREQDHQTLKPHLVEETYEVVDALDRRDWDNLVEELGDLFLQVVMHAQFAEEADTFDLLDVAEGINAKLVRRHPHVFGDVEARTSGQVLANWEAIKRHEKAARGEPRTAPRTLLEGVPRSLPALAAAQTISRKAARVGFQWPSVAEAQAKLAEELAELGSAATPEKEREELGDLLFAAVNLCRLHKVDAEEALREANRKFSERYALLEQLAARDGRPLADCDPGELRELWAQAKRQLREEP